MKSLRSWWHAGEDGAVVVYRKGMWALLVRMSLCLIIICLFVPSIPQFRTVLPVVALPFLRGIAEGRRAIIFTDTLLIYRPPFADVLRIPIAEITSLKKALVPQSYFFRGRWVSGLCLTMANGEIIPLPLNIAKEDEVLQRLSAVTAKPIDGYEIARSNLKTNAT